MSAWARIAHLHEAREDWDKAHEYQTKALEATYGTPPVTIESRAWCRAILGEIELRRGRPAAAREQYGKGLSESPDHPLVLEHLAELDAIEGRDAAAVDAYRRILAKRRNPQIEISLSELLAKAGNKSEAAALRARAIEFMERAVESGNEGFLRPLAEERLAARRFEEAAALQVRDVLLRPTPDACEVLQRIEREAKAAGRRSKGRGSGSAGDRRSSSRSRCSSSVARRIRACHETSSVISTWRRHECEARARAPHLSPSAFAMVIP